MSDSNVLDFLLSCFTVVFGKRIKFDDVAISVSITRVSIGEGSYSNVLKAIDVNNFRKYAIKKMLIQSEDSELGIKNEIEALKRFKHPNMVTFLAHKYSMDRSQNSRVVYLLFPLIQSGNLRQHLNAILLKEQSKFDFLHLLKCFKGITEALLLMHNYNPSYVHNDLKPENILLTDDGRPLLTDFGSVRLAQINITNRNDKLRVAEEAAQFCTPQYRPPELYEPPLDSVLDSRTDVWALGCLFYAWWFGYSPYEITFDKMGQPSSTDCSYLRILSLSGHLPKPTTPMSDKDLKIFALSEFILIHDYKMRPFTQDVLQRVDTLIDNIQSAGTSSSAV